MTYKEALEYAKEEFEAAGIPGDEPDSWLLLQHVADITRSEYFLYPERTLSEEQEKCFFDMVGLRKNRIPLQHIVGYQEFMGMNFIVNEHVLIPRQDTEILVEAVLGICRSEQKKQKTVNCQLENCGTENSESGNAHRLNILDMCTGSGCIAISLAVLLKKTNASSVNVSAVDISEEALEVARKNSEALCGEDRQVHFYHGDLFSPLPKDEKFFIIVSNPPYIPTDVISGLMPEVREFEPVLALDGSGDGLAFYRRIAKEAGNHLISGGWLLFEIGCEQGNDVRNILEEAGFSDITVRKDYAGLDRVIICRKDNKDV